MLRALSLAYWAFIVVTCPVFFLGALAVYLLTLPFDRRKVLLHLYSCLWATFYVRINPLWGLHVTGRDRLPWRGPAVIVANHASLVDILVLFGLFRPFKWISKSGVFKVPFVGWNMRLNGYVPLVRGDKPSIVKMLARCDELLGKGNPVLFFPEGTRSADGTLKPFKDGAFDLAVKHSTPLVPIAVHGTARALPKHGFILRAHIDAKVEVLEPLDPRDHADAQRLKEAARAAIAAALGQPAS